MAPSRDFPLAWVAGVLECGSSWQSFGEPFPPPGSRRPTSQGWSAQAWHSGPSGVKTVPCRAGGGAGLGSLTRRCLEPWVVNSLHLPFACPGRPAAEAALGLTGHCPGGRLWPCVPSRGLTGPPPRSSRCHWVLRPRDPGGLFRGRQPRGRGQVSEHSFPQLAAHGRSSGNVPGSGLRWSLLECHLTLSPSPPRPRHPGLSGR